MLDSREFRAGLDGFFGLDESLVVLKLPVTDVQIQIDVGALQTETGQRGSVELHRTA